MKKPLTLILSALAVCSLMYVIEAVLQASYLTKFFIRIALFIGIPLIFFGRDMFRWIRSDSIESSIWWGIGTIVVMSVAYLGIRDWIDMDMIRGQLAKIGITSHIYFFVSLYITLGNSFLEEYFFRGFLTLGLDRYGVKKWHTVLISSFIFALYHVAIFWTWFTPLLSLGLLVGLVGGGIFFSFLTLRTRGYLTSWIVHACADAVIVIIGAQMFLG